ncbi:tryptase [Culex quinquefasciatus]|uniref:Tryptase n=1 Tax=Culex quinquefasciatus TaxID=7176 RepID=B0XEL1_CULQU|nr:tryptase [Culex quinquefasciatus]|eukprot:XP_001868083.1 tryptase [Culex quinquefasciatus]
MAAIGWTNPDGRGGIQWRCGGSLVWDNFVLTAAHCVLDSSSDAPDVVRLGDIDLYSSVDDEWVQQFRIVKIVRHPEHRFTANYHDIALLKLDRNVVQQDGTVIPACLWTDDEVRFKKLVATGWGRTGVGSEYTPKLLQVSLSPISDEECSVYYPTDRKLKQGLRAQHLCARDEQMDTCEGDSGGPLQIKLMHNGRMTPFIVGVTSFGSACGISNPGVYTRVSAYFRWIVDTMREHGAVGLETNYNETLCALRYVTYREYDKKVAQKYNETFTTGASTGRRIYEAEVPEQLATVRWNGHGPDCFGVIVDEDTVLTVADCTDFKGKSPSFVNYLNNKVMPISKIVVHPDHMRGSAYNNIAILNYEDYAINGYGKGRRDINKLVFYGNNHTIDPHQTNHLIRFESLDPSDCTVPERFTPRLPQGLASEHLCLGQDVFLVPGSCEQLTGSMIGRSAVFYYYTKALSLLSRDCGFGEHLISTRLYSHVEWMKTVLLPSYRDSSAVKIGWISNNYTNFRCLGSVISRSFVLTTASCLKETQPNVVELMESGVRNNVDSVLAHPGFNATDRTNDIALIKLKTPLSWSSTIYPICLWTNTTHTPMKLDINYRTTYDEKSVVDYALKTYVSTAKKLHPMYNSDCQLAHRTTLKSSQLCTRSPYHSAVCVAPTDQLIWADKDRSSSVMYLVGMATRACGPPVKWKYNVFTRISAFAQWISENAFGF